MTSEAAAFRRILVTGGAGFLGWHFRVRLRALLGATADIVDRRTLSDPDVLAKLVNDADAIVHLAGVNRADSDVAVEQGNIHLARSVAAAVVAAGRPLHIVFSNSIHASMDSAYGRGKRAAAEILADAAARTGSTLTDMWLPNLFGEHGRPHYNSFVATFCHEIAAGREPTVTDDKSVPLLHAQDASAALVSAVEQRTAGQVSVEAPDRSVSHVCETLLGFRDRYAEGQIPDLSDRFAVDLFNTYRSYVFPKHFPMRVRVNADQRGRLFECVRAHGGTGQTFISTTTPGVTRGEHYHLRKVERFFVVQGEAEISLRKVFHDDIVQFRLSGKEPAFVDMPTMWVHNIRNIGSTEVITLFWADQLFDPQSPDTYWELVEPGGEMSA